MDFFDSWWFLIEHPMIKDERGVSCFRSCLDIDVIKVNPDTLRVDEEQVKNTLVVFSLEFGPWIKASDQTESERSLFPYGLPAHDYELDCRSPNFEDAVIQLASLVQAKYGTYEQLIWKPS